MLLSEAYKKKLEPKPADASLYCPDNDEIQDIMMVQKALEVGAQVLNKPRLEFNDLSVVARSQIDRAQFNTYVPNNGDGAEGDIVNGWRSNAIRPVIRNKAITTVSYLMSRFLYPGVRAFDEENKQKSEEAQVMRDLIQVAGIQSKYEFTALKAAMTMMFSPATIIFTEFAESYRKVRSRANPNEATYVLDEENSGHSDFIVPVEQFYIQDFYQNDVQKQGFVAWRRVVTYESAASRWGNTPNFEFVKKGKTVVLGGTVGTFYELTDPDLQGENVEEVLYWNRTEDLFHVVVGGVLITKHNNPNPRLDKKYPFAVSGFELIDEGRCFYYKSLAFKLQEDARIANTLYPMIIDGTYLSMFPPTYSVGGEMTEESVIVPGMTVNFSDKDSKVSPILNSPDLRAGLETLLAVDKSINTTSPEAVDTNTSRENPTATQIVEGKSEANMLMSLILMMIAHLVQQYGNLKISDILQFDTIGKVKDGVSNTLLYKTFILPESNTSGKRGRILSFDGSLPDEMSEEDVLLASAAVQSEEKDLELYKINPSLFAKFKYSAYVSPETMEKYDEARMRAYAQEMYTLLANSPSINQDELVRLLLENSPLTRRKVDKFINKQQLPEGNDGGVPQTPFAAGGFAAGM